MRSRIAAAAWILLLAFLPWNPCQAADVVLGERVVFRLPDEAQAAALTARLEALLQSGAAAEAIRVGKSEGQTALFWGEEALLVVTAEMGKANSSTPPALAGVWAENLRKVVRSGLLRVDRNRLELPVGGEQVVRVTGLAKGPLEALPASPGLQVTVDQESGSVSVVGLAVGRTRVDLRRGNGREVVWVHVKDWAGSLPRQVEIEVTGRPAPGRMVAQAALSGTATLSSVQPGCRLLLESESLELPPVPAEQAMRLELPMAILGGEDYYPVRANVPVLVRNLPLEPVESNLLLVSNRPERLTQDGILMGYTFTRKEPTRLMYSHLNDLRQRRNLWVNVANPGDEAVRLLVSSTWAGPERNEVHVGQTSARRFLEAVSVQAGYVVTLPPRSALELVAHDMQPKALVTGFMNFRILEGDRVTVEVRTAAQPSQNDGSPLPHLGAPFNPFKIHPHGVFAQPFFELDGEFVVGGDSLVQRYGESPWLIDFETGLPNNGNFGVLYKSLVELRNPDSIPRRVGLYFSPVAGPAGGTFLVDGKVVQAPFRRVDNEALLTEIELSPGESRMVEVVTFPEASSNYPAQFEFRDQEPVSGAPARTAGSVLRGGGRN